MASLALDGIPAAVTIEHTHTEFVSGEWGAAVAWRDYDAVATRRGKRVIVAELTEYPDGRIYARRGHAVRTSTDYADWSAICRATGGTSEDYYRGHKFAGNPS